MSSADEREDEIDNTTNKSNDWSGFRKEFIKNIIMLVVIALVGALFLVHTGGQLFLSKEDLLNLKQNDIDLFKAIMEVQSQKMGGIDDTKAPYTDVGSTEDDAFFSLKKWAFPYKNYFNENEEWEFDGGNWDEAKPVLHTCGVALQKSFSGSYSTGRFIIESLRKFGFDQGKKSRKLKKSFLPSILFWVFGCLVTIFVNRGMFLYGSMSVIIMAAIQFITGTLTIFNIPDPPEPPKEKEEEKEPDPLERAQEATKEMMYLAGPAGQTQVALEKSGAGAVLTSAATTIKDGIVAIVAAIIWFLKRALKSLFLFFFITIVVMGVGAPINAIWQTLMFMGWYFGPLFDDASRKLMFQYIGKQKYLIALISYFIVLGASVNNLHNWNPKYMYISGILIFLLILFGKIK